MSDKAPQPRDTSLDALRGLAVLGMVLSGHIAFGGAGDGVLPAWMYHAQLPPPAHRYLPTLAGLTWVDLVFPLFLFALGAAIPLAMGRLAEKVAHRQGRAWSGTSAVLKVALRRFALLLFLALFFQHLKPSFVATTTLAVWSQPLALLGLLALALAYGPQRLAWRALGWALAIGLLLVLRQADGTAAFALKRSDIILVVLANMALFATLLWWWTRHHPVWRWALLVPLALLLYGGKAPDSVNAWLLQSSPAPWAVQIAYLKYLFIVLPGTVVGERMEHEARFGTAPAPAPVAWLGLVSAAVVVGVLAGLQAREVPLTLLMAGFASALLAWRSPGLRPAIGLLMVGLLLEPLEGGIRKDGLNLSYVLTTAGLSWLSLAALRALGERRWGAGCLAVLAGPGRNAVLAYVLGALGVMPLLHLSGLHDAWAALSGNAFEAVLRGVLFTAAVAVIVALANRRGWVLKA